jgi:hypothetical protein
VTTILFAIVILLSRLARELMTRYLAYATCHVEATSGIGPDPPDRVTGRARQLCRGNSDVDFLGDLKRVVDLNAEVAYCSTMIDGWSRSWE